MKLFLFYIFLHTAFSDNVIVSYWHSADESLEAMDAVSEDWSEKIGNSLPMAPFLIANKVMWETLKIPCEVSQIGKDLYRCYVRFNTVDLREDEKWRTFFDAGMKEAGRISVFFIPKGISKLIAWLPTAKRRIGALLFLVALTGKDDHTETTHAISDIDRRVEKIFQESGNKPISMKILLEKLKETDSP